MHARRGRWIVAAGVGLALMQAVVTLLGIIAVEGATVDPFLAGILSYLSIIGWAFLLAAAIERRMALTSLAAGTFLVVTLLSLLGLVDSASGALINAMAVLPVAGWGLLILAALLELPRHSKELTAAAQ